MNAYPDEVIDEHGERFALEPEPLGVGGQGAVFRCKTNPSVAVKLVLDGAGRPLRREDGGVVDEISARISNGIEIVRTLDLPDDVGIALPASRLEQHVGYTMTLLEDMAPIQQLIAPGGCEDLAAFYAEGGGLKRRLVLLTKLARQLARVHGRGITYVDLSPQNVFISTDPLYDELWLIDPDNMRYSVNLRETVYTPFYGAPEIVRGDIGATTLSDRFSFAALAYKVLCQRDAFLGARVEDVGWDEAEVDEDLELKAQRGAFPWVEDPADDSNYAENGIPASWLLPDSIIGLFQRAFGSDEAHGEGRDKPGQRPSLVEWFDVLTREAMMLFTCPNCKNTRHIYANRGACTWCDSVDHPDIIYVQSRTYVPDEDLLEPGLAPEALMKSRVHASAILPLDRHQTLLGPPLTSPLLCEARTRFDIEVYPDTNGAHFKALGQAGDVELTDAGRVHPLSSPHFVDFRGRTAPWRIDCGPFDQQHRVLSLGFFAGGGSDEG